MIRFRSGNTFRMKVFLILVALLASSTTCSHICCPLMGCVDIRFLLGLHFPFCRIEFNVIYSLYTRNNPVDGEIMDPKSVIISPLFVSTRQTVLIVHGYISNSNSTWMKPLKDEFLKKGDMNVILIDWGDGADKISYKEAADNTVEVGKLTALLIQNILTVTNATSQSMWCVGHSLGAHVCGYTGKNMQKQAPLGRITGMDPAGPLFEDKPNRTAGLNSSCAQLVDVIHTDPGVYGTIRTLGHIDFYPQGFRYKADQNNKTTEYCDDICSHSRSIDFMTISIKNNCFLANQHCTSYDSIPGSCTTDLACTAYVGYDAIQSCNKTGILYLKVATDPPFCLN